MSLNVFELMAKISLDKTEYDKSLKAAGADTQSFGSKLSGGLAAAAKVGLAAATTAVTAASGALVGLSKAAVSNYASYEQLVGGVDKLYGEASEKIQQYADNAYKTAGMSANAYMETATSFSAALINSLEGDVNKAADITDIAMRAMSDNVNIFGSDFQSVQYAFQGFAKQNYTMLDNLKLGYGGTKEEMKRLIEDANKYRETIGETADLSMDSFADVVLAIQSIQEAQNIAGTTAKEAMGTIEGAAAATKAAWDNVITSIGRGEGVGEAFQGFADSLFGAQDGEGLLNQILPRIETVFNGIASFMETAGPLFADKIPVIVESVLPAILETGVSLINSLADGLVSALPTIMDVGTEILLSLLSSILTLLPRVGEVALQVIGQLATSLGEAAPTLIPDAVNAIIDTIITLLENVDALIDGAIALLTGLIEGIINNVPILTERMPEVVEALVRALVENAPKLAVASLELLLTLMGGMITAIPEAIKSIPDIIQGIVDGFIEGASGFLDVGKAFVSNLGEGITTEAPTLGVTFDEFIAGIADKIAELGNVFSGIYDTVVGVFESIKTGISDKWDEIVLSFDEGGGGLAGAIEVFFDQIAFSVKDFLNMLGELVGVDMSAIYEAFRDWWFNIRNRIVEIVYEIQTKLVEIWNQIVEALRPLLEALQYLFDTIFTAIQVVIERIITAIHDKILEIWNAIATALQPILDAISSAIETAWSFIHDTVTDIANTIYDTVSDVFDSMADAIGNALDVVLDTVSGVFDEIRGIVDDLIDSALDWGLDLMQNFADGITEGISWVTDGIRGLADRIRGLIHFSEPDYGPLADFSSYAPDMMKLFAKGIKDNERLVTDQIEDSFNFGKVIEDQNFGFSVSGSASAVSGSASMDRVVALLQRIVDEGLHSDIDLKGDAADIFSLVRRKNHEFTEATGYSGL